MEIVLCRELACSLNAMAVEHNAELTKFVKQMERNPGIKYPASHPAIQRVLVKEINPDFLRIVMDAISGRLYKSKLHSGQIILLAQEMNQLIDAMKVQKRLILTISSKQVHIDWKNNSREMETDEKWNALDINNALMYESDGGQFLSKIWSVGAVGSLGRLPKMTRADITSANMMQLFRPTRKEPTKDIDKEAASTNTSGTQSSASRRLSSQQLKFQPLPSSGSISASSTLRNPSTASGSRAGRASGTSAGTGSRDVQGKGGNEAEVRVSEFGEVEGRNSTAGGSSRGKRVRMNSTSVTATEIPQASNESRPHKRSAGPSAQRGTQESNNVASGSQRIAGPSRPRQIEHSQSARGASVVGSQRLTARSISESSIRRLDEHQVAVRLRAERQ